VGVTYVRGALAFVDDASLRLEAGPLFSEKSVQAKFHEIHLSATDTHRSGDFGHGLFFNDGEVEDLVMLGIRLGLEKLQTPFRNASLPFLLEHMTESRGIGGNLVNERGIGPCLTGRSPEKVWVRSLSDLIGDSPSRYLEQPVTKPALGRVRLEILQAPRDRDECTLLYLLRLDGCATRPQSKIVKHSSIVGSEGPPSLGVSRLQAIHQTPVSL
jgi:hypothetical protein